MIRRPPRSTPLYSSAASDVYKRQNLPCPLVFKRGELLLGIDLGGGDIEWIEANPPWIPMWHSKARADVQEIYCTGWTPAGRRNFGGPIQYLDGSWSPSPYDANDDGFDDFWAY